MIAAGFDHGGQSLILHHLTAMTRLAFDEHSVVQQANASLDRDRTTVALIAAATRLKRDPVADAGRHARGNRSRIMKDHQNARDAPRVQRLE